MINKVLNQWRERAVGEASRRLHLHFYAKPLEIVIGRRWPGRGDPVRAHASPTAPAASRAPARSARSPIQAIYRAVGYFGSPLADIPFDERRGVIPNHEGQVLADDNSVLPGVYATGWIKRGPVGLIGHTKSDAMETIQHVVNDQASWWAPSHPDEQSDHRPARPRAAWSYTTSTAGTSSTSTSWRSARPRGACVRRSFRATR